jgi:hypothetical protein
MISHQGQYTIIAQLSKLRSNRNLKFTSIMSLFWAINGCSTQSIEVLQKCGLALSTKSYSSLQEHLARIKIAEASVVARGPHKNGYDNINISTSIFVEQRNGAPVKVTSGTFTVLYALRNATAEAIQLGPILERAQAAGDLSFNADVRPTFDQQVSFHHQCLINVIEILAEYVPAFEPKTKLTELQHKIRRQMPQDYVTSP